ncbi:hypothetical protein BBJ28_00023912 [Nothophytophthora sp. Chile5]|nr:hypothetical protein BBJ28_00023912 [Nothophytophthora sp. Chile5]
METRTSPIAPCVALFEQNRILDGFSTMSTIRATFKAFEYAKFGDVLKEVKLNRSTAQKALQAGEVRVKVLSAAVNPIDY